MNDDALAAVVAAAHLLFARESEASDAPARAEARWSLAARLRTDDAARARLVARARSRWTQSGRFHD